MAKAALEVANFARHLENFQGRAASLQEEASFQLVPFGPFAPSNSFGVNSQKEICRANGSPDEEDKEAQSMKMDKVPSLECGLFESKLCESQFGWGNRKHDEYQLTVVEEGELQLVNSLNLATLAYAKRWTVQNTGPHTPNSFLGMLL